MPLSIVIATHNSAPTINECLSAIFASDFKDFEVIIIDDASTDQTLEIAGGFPCRVIKLNEHFGTAYARKTGINESAHNTTVFIDADIVIFNDTLNKLVSYLKDNPQASAVFGILSKTHPNKNFFSIYKNLYMHYVLKSCPDEIDFIYGSFFAVKNDGFSQKVCAKRYAEDTELGIQMYETGCRIFLEKELEVVHLKKYTLISFLKNDFCVPYHWAALFLRHHGLKMLVKTKRFCHARLMQILGIITAFISMLMLPINTFIAGVFFLIFLFLNLRFFLFIYSEKKILFLIQSVLVTWLDAIIMCSGVLAGFSAGLYKKITSSYSQHT